MTRGAKRLLQPHETSGARVVRWDETFPAHPKQRAFVQSANRFRYFYGAVGTGKTVALVDAAIFAALRTPAKYAGCRHYVLGRTGRDLRDVILPKFRERLELFSEMTGRRLYRPGAWRESDRWLVWPNGVITAFRPYSHPDKYRGINAITIGLDELEFSESDPLNVWKIVQGRLREGPAWLRSCYVASSPNGAHSPIIRMFQRHPEWFSVHATMFDNPYIFDRGEPCLICRGADPLCADTVGCGGVGLASSYIDAARSSMSERAWRQEGLGELLAPRGALLADEYDEQKHVIPWAWDPRLPWILCVDWGESAAYACAIQVLDRPVRVPEIGRTLPIGTWVVAAEIVPTDTTQARFRDRLRALVEKGDLGDGRWLRESHRAPQWPSAGACDRAIRSERHWLYQYLTSGRLDVSVDYCRSFQQQQVRAGVGAIGFMLAPLGGESRLYLSDRLYAPGSDRVGLRQALVNYGHVLDSDGNPTDNIEKNTENCHPMDSLRYGVVTTAHNPKWHGGAPLAYVDHTPRKRDTEPDLDWDREFQFDFGRAA